MKNELIATLYFFAFLIAAVGIAYAAPYIIAAGIGLALLPVAAVILYGLARVIFAGAYLLSVGLGKLVGGLINAVNSAVRMSKTNRNTAQPKDDKDKNKTAEGNKDKDKKAEDDIAEDKKAKKNKKSTFDEKTEKILQIIDRADDKNIGLPIAERNKLIETLNELKEKDGFVNGCGGKFSALEEILNRLEWEIKSRDHTPAELRDLTKKWAECLKKSYVTKIIDEKGNKEYHYGGKESQVEKIKEKVKDIVGTEHQHLGNSVNRLEAHLLHELDQKCESIKNEGTEAGQAKEIIAAHVNQLTKYSLRETHKSMANWE